MRTQTKFDFFQNKKGGCMVAVIFTSDYDFQVIRIIEGNNDRAWDLVRKMEASDVFKKNGIDNYDVVSFSTGYEMDEWILEQIKENREKRKKLKSTSKKWRKKEMVETKEQLVELIYKALPYSQQITQLEFTNSNDSIRFEWRGEHIQVKLSLGVSIIDDKLIGSSNLTMLIEKILKMIWIKDVN